ncbi:ABC transporter permease [Alkalihalobacillus sp. LMS39]|uniref:ABC transporter permease n=1 Tax=Alkalihalobacillus sp. LMS39 TaxID=2924032 RepID=UPI001FB25AAB|nr:ABC transporter permease [Alkalihalobacillus sp. LMS39]UOE94078.1 FtsX-like permease family protein [Alkalihalobacillus sp. LMS39]
MNIMQKLTIRHLKENKRRTLVTVVGTIISVAMIAAVATLAISFLDLMQRHVIANQGEWHVQYHNVNEEQVKAIKDDEQTKRFMLSRDRGYSYLAGSENQYKPYLFIKEYNKSGLENFPILLKEGRLPENPNELVLSTEIASNAKVEYQIGDTLTLDVGERKQLDEEVQEERLTQQYSLRFIEDEVGETLVNTESVTYEVVGIIERPTWEPSWAPGYTAISYTDETLITAESPVTVSVVVNKLNRSIFENTEQLVEDIGLNLNFISYNNELFRYHGITSDDNLKSLMYSLAGIIMSVIIVGSVALIYNAFAISVSERARHLGMLSSVGATKRQKRNSVFFEGVIIGAISIPIGLISGIVGIGITFWFSNRLLQDALNVSQKLTVVVTPWSIVTAIVVSIVTIFISTYLPARKASKISAIDAIRQTTDIKLNGKVVKTSKLVRMLFGFEAEIGLKNLKRNKRKYRITVFSLAVSIILFLVVSFFTYSLEKGMELSQGNVNYDIQISPSGNHEIDSELVSSITSLEDVTAHSIVRETFFYAMIDEENMSDPLKKRAKEEPEMLEGGQFPYYVEVYSLDDESFKRYAEEVGFDQERLMKEEMRAVVINNAVYEDPDERKIVEIKPLNMKVGETIDLVYDDWENEEKDFVSEITIEAMTDRLPKGVTSGGGEASVKMVISETNFNQLLALENRTSKNSYLYLNSSEPLKTQNEIEELSENTIYIYNVFKSRQQSEQMILFMSVFIYGFIVLITLISIANIFNTISTGMALRKREFAMLKSVGMTPKSFHKMIQYESLFYGINSLLYGIPISIGIMYLLHRSMMNSFEYGFELPWLSFVYVIIAVFVIVGFAMLYSLAKVRKDNIIETLKQENI